MDEALEILEEGTEPLEPNGFRAACVELLESWAEYPGASEPLDESFVTEFFQVTYEGTGGCWVDATERFYAALDALLVPPLCEFAASEEGGTMSIHPAVFESAATAPMLDFCVLDAAWMTTDLDRRMRAIATLESLLGDDEA